jgi:c-di-GMP-binding flagellar brake protein YcgR
MSRPRLFCDNRYYFTIAPNPCMTEPAAPAETTPAPDVQYRFADMHLQPGDRLQIHCPTHVGKTRHIARVIGYVDGVSLLVTVPAHQGTRAEFLENEIVVVQAFSRNSAFAFKCTIDRMYRRPFDYMHLSFPKSIQGTVIRKATRVRIDLEAQVSTGTGEEATARIADLSATGAMLRAEQPLGARGERLRLRFRVKLHDLEREIAGEAVILNVREDGGHHMHGVEFRELPADERMVLRSLIYQHMIENPASLA